MFLFAGVPDRSVGPSSVQRPSSPRPRGHWTGPPQLQSVENKSWRRKKENSLKRLVSKVCCHVHKSFPQGSKPMSVSMSRHGTWGRQWLSFGFGQGDDFGLVQPPQVPIVGAALQGRAALGRGFAERGEVLTLLGQELL